MTISDVKKDTTTDKGLFLDLNCDLGQSYGVYRNEPELQLVPYVSSVSISCGLHAGDPLTIMNMLKLAAENNLSVGAHVGYPDIQGFGYRGIQLTDEEMQAVIVYQIGALASLAKLYNINVEFVRPHGALYRQAAEDYKVAYSLAKAVAAYDPWLVLVGAPSEHLDRAGEEANLRIAKELQLDKKYDVNGNIDFSLGDVLDVDYSTRLLDSIIKHSSVINTQGGRTKVKYNTIHLNMRDASSVEIAKKAASMVSSPVTIPGTFVANSGWLE
jgi:UPF0271 protein